MYPILLHATVKIREDVLKRVSRASGLSEAVELLQDERVLRDERVSVSYTNLGLTNLKPDHPSKRLLWELATGIAVRPLLGKNVPVRCPENLPGIFNVTTLVQPLPSRSLSSQDSGRNPSGERASNFLPYGEESESFFQTNERIRVYTPLLNFFEDCSLKVVGAEVSLTFDTIALKNSSSPNVILYRLFRKLTSEYDFFLPHMTLHHLFSMRSFLFGNELRLLEYLVGHSEIEAIDNNTVYDVFFPESEELEGFFKHVFSKPPIFVEPGISHNDDVLWPFQNVPLYVFSQRFIGKLRESQNLKEYFEKIPHLLKELDYINGLVRYSASGLRVFPKLEPSGTNRDAYHDDESIVENTTNRENLGFLTFFYNLNSNKITDLFFSPYFNPRLLNYRPHLLPEVADWYREFANSNYTNGKNALSVFKKMFAVMRGIPVLDVTERESRISNLLAEYFEAVFDATVSPVSRHVPVISDDILIPDFDSSRAFPYIHFPTIWSFASFLNMLYADSSVRCLSETLGLKRDPNLTFQILERATREGLLESIKKFKAENKQMFEEVGMAEEELEHLKHETLKEVQTIER